MASIKVKFRLSPTMNGQGSIYYQIIHDRKQKILFSAYRVFETEWSEGRHTVTVESSSSRYPFILSIRESIQWDLKRFNNIIQRLELHGVPYTADDVAEEFNRYITNYSLFNFMGSIILLLKQQGRIRTSETYTTALSSFKKFRANEDIMLDWLDSNIMQSYETWLKKSGKLPNTISFYTRILRAVYNRAVDNEVIENRHPFRHVYTGIDKTVKRALPLQTIKKIKYMDLSRSPALDYARDMFIMSFMLRGMSFVDMAFLRKSDLVDGRIIYRRRKTGQLLIIKWTKDMQKILDKYPENNSDYLLPVIKTRNINERCAYRNAGYNINHNLKSVARRIGIKIPLTLYMARHSWASAARSKGIPLSVISEGMGHDSESTTLIYLASLDTSVVDKANSLILKSL